MGRRSRTLEASPSPFGRRWREAPDEALTRPSATVSRRERALNPRRFFFAGDRLYRGLLELFPEFVELFLQVLDFFLELAEPVQFRFRFRERYLAGKEMRVTDFFLSG